MIILYMSFLPDAAMERPEISDSMYGISETVRNYLMT